MSLGEIRHVIKHDPSRIIWVYPDTKQILVRNYEEKDFRPICLEFNDDDWNTAIDLIRHEIKNKPDLLDRTEPWECLDHRGIYSFDKDNALQKLRAKTEDKANRCFSFC